MDNLYPGLPNLAQMSLRTCKVYSSVGASFPCAVLVNDKCLRLIRSRQARPNNRLSWLLLGAMVRVFRLDNSRYEMRNVKDETDREK